MSEFENITTQEQFILAYRQWLRAIMPPPDAKSIRDADHGSFEAS